MILGSTILVGVITPSLVRRAPMPSLAILLDRPFGSLFRGLGFPTRSARFVFLVLSFLLVPSFLVTTLAVAWFIVALFLELFKLLNLSGERDDLLLLVGRLKPFTVFGADPKIISGVGEQFVDRKGTCSVIVCVLLITYVGFKTCVATSLVSL